MVWQTQQLAAMAATVRHNTPSDVHLLADHHSCTACQMVVHTHPVKLWASQQLAHSKCLSISIIEA